MNKNRTRILWNAFLLLLVIYLYFHLTGPQSRTSGTGFKGDPIGSLDGLTDELRRAFAPAGHFQPVPEPGPGDWLAQHDEPGQPYDRYVNSAANRPDAERSKIYLQPLGVFSQEATDRLALLLDYAVVYFQIQACINTPLPLEDVDVRTRINRGTGRRQLNALDILEQLKPRVPRDAFCVLSLTQEDLYPEDSWNYVFGYASYRERVGVYSFARYDPTFFGQARPDHFPQLFLRRSLQILAHETAHMYSLKHCIHYHCAMNGSNNLAESDAQPLHLCPVCLRKLHYAGGFEVEQRYAGLHEYYKKVGLEGEADWIRARHAWILGNDEPQ